MFWKKKQVIAAPVVEGTAGTTETKPLEKKGEAPSQPKAQIPKAVKLPGPRQMPGMIEKYLVDTYKMDAGIAHVLKILVRKRPQSERAFECRIFDPEEAEAREVKVKDYTTLDTHADLILYEGWYDDDSKHVELIEKKKMNYDVPLFTEAEIAQQIEALSKPGSSVFFYQNAGSAAGGPLGRGVAIVELNPNYGAHKGRKYIIYTANVVGLEPVAKRNRLYDSDKPKEIAKWIAQSHKKRAY